MLTNRSPSTKPIYAPNLFAPETSLATRPKATHPRPEPSEWESRDPPAPAGPLYSVFRRPPPVIVLFRASPTHPRLKTRQSNLFARALPSRKSSQGLAQVTPGLGVKQARGPRSRPFTGGFLFSRRTCLCSRSSEWSTGDAQNPGPKTSCNDNSPVNTNVNFGHHGMSLQAMGKICIPPQLT